jgi:hypothetical protein
MTKFKMNGTYLEIGASDPKDNNNSYILERDLNWTGISLELDNELCSKLNKERRNKFLEEDAIVFDYSEFLINLNSFTTIDYLSLDIEPPCNTLKVLKKLPLNDVRFSVITFEHDFYSSGENVMLESRQILRGYGYEKIVSNVMSNGRDFEDWYVDPDIISSSISNPFISEKIEAQDIFINKF